jgi:phosphate transport system permease protein
MSTATFRPPGPPDTIDLRAKRSGRSVRNGFATAFMVGSLLVVLVPLVFVLVTIIRKGASSLSWDFLTADIPPVRRTGPGMGPAVAGTLVTTAVASALAIPLGVLGAVYLNEYGGRSRIAKLLRFLADVMTGVPSIVMGLFIFTIWNLHRGTEGASNFAGGLALGCLMLPVIIRSSEVMLRLVPNHLREASLALGSSKARTIVTVVLPAAFPGILSGVLLAVARAAGETAPVLFTIGAAHKANWNPWSGPSTSLAREIFSNAQTSFPGAQDRAWGAALTLIVLAFIFLVVSRIVASFFDPERIR